MMKNNLLKRIGVKAFNVPKKTPNHPSKSHVVVAKVGNKIKTVRFGQQGVTGSPKRKGESESDKKRRDSFNARHSCSTAKDKLSARYWSCVSKW